MSVPTKFLNEDKYRRAESVVMGTKGVPYTEESVEKHALTRALAEGKDLKPKTPELIEAVYRLLGGAVSGDVKPEPKRAKESAADGSQLVESKKEGSEVEEVQGDGSTAPARGGRRGRSE